MGKILSKVFLGFGLFALLCICGGGCASVSMDSTKDQAAVHQVHRLFILINQPQMEASISQSLAAAFQNCFSNSPVQLDMAVVNPLTLDEKTYDSLIEKFYPDDVLIIRVQVATVDPYGGYPIIRYDASLFNAITHKREWRAIINNSGDTQVMNRRMKEMAQSIVSQLKVDGFL